MAAALPLPGPGDTIKMRASGLGELFDDSLRWKAKVIDGIRGLTYGRSHLGTSIHFGTGWYDNERTLPDGTPDTEIAVDKFLECLRDDEDVHWTDISKSKAEQIGIALVAEYCQEVSSLFEWIKVEAACDPIEIEMPNGIVFEITGHVDRVYEMRVQPHVFQFGVADLKSGSGVIKADGSIDIAKHGVQLAIYELLEIAASRLVGEKMTAPALVIALPTSGKHKITFESVDNPRTLLFGDGGAHEGYLIAASKIIEHQLYYGNPRSMLCTDKFCPIYADCFYRRG